MSSETSVLLSRKVISVNHDFTFFILFIVYFGTLERKFSKNLSASQ